MTNSCEQKKVCVGMITTAHGVRGQVKVKSFTAQADDFASYGALSDEQGKQNFTVKIVGQAGDQFLVQIDGVKDRNTAEALRGVKLYVDRDELPDLDDGEFYYTDLIGMTAKTVDGKNLGKVKGVYNFGAGDMLEIGNMADYLPFTDTIVPHVDLVNKVVTVCLPDYVEVKPTAQAEE